MSEKLAAGRPREVAQLPEASLARIGRQALARETDGRIPPGSPPPAGYRLVIEAGRPRVRLESLPSPAADWERQQRWLVEQVECLGRPAGLPELEANPPSADRPPVSANVPLLLLHRACQQGRLQHIAWGAYAPPGYHWRADSAASLLAPPAAADRLLDVLAWARGPAHLQTVVEELGRDNFRPVGLSIIGKQANLLKRAGRLHHQGPHLYALAEYGIAGLWLSKRGIIRAVVDRLTASQSGVVHWDQIRSLASRVVEALPDHASPAILARLDIQSTDIGSCLHRLGQKQLIERIDNQLYGRPGYDPAWADRLRALSRPAKPARPQPAKPKPRPKPASAEPRPKAPSPTRHQQLQARRERFDRRLLELVGDQRFWTKDEVLSLAKQAGISPDRVRRRLPVLVSQGRLQELDAGIYAGRQFDSDRYQAEPGLDRRVVAVLESARRSENQLLKKQELVDRINADGHQRPSAGVLSELLKEMVVDGRIRRPKRGSYAAKGARVGVEFSAGARLGLGRRIMKVVGRLDDESLFDDDDYLMEYLFERVSRDGNGPVNRKTFDNLAELMVERRRRFRRGCLVNDDDES